MIDFTTDLGKRVLDLLDSEQVIWLTTVDSKGSPQPRPVWFLWDGSSLLIYSSSDVHKLRHLARNARVSLNFNSDPGRAPGRCFDRRGARRSGRPARGPGAALSREVREGDCRVGDDA